MRILIFPIFTFLSTPVAFAQEEFKVPEITVMGDRGTKNAFEFLPTVSQLSGKQLEKKKRTTLGETIGNEAGVTSSFFGPNASRPIIRGLDGDRVRILENGIGTLDASAASPDHAVSMDPLLIESIETIRGPSALLYGSSAIGGVVQINNLRITDKLLNEKEIKISSQYSTVDEGKSIGAMIRQPFGRFVFEADAALRSTNDYRIPNFARPIGTQISAPLEPEETEDQFKVTNSANRTVQGAFGTSYIFDRGSAGLSFSTYQSLYGTVAEKDVSIDMRRYRLDLAGNLKADGFIESIRFKSGSTIYKHQEIAGGTPATTFRNRGLESRMDFKHKSLANFSGVFGVQQQYSLFSAVGDEAYVPTTVNTSIAGFIFEEMNLGKWKPSFGLRTDLSGVTAKDSATFGPERSKNFVNSSGSIGVAYDFVPGHTLTLQETYTTRAPNYAELFANGPHAATSQFEVGNGSIASERAWGTELSYRTKSDFNETRISAYIQSFNNFISLTPTDTTDTDSGLVISQFEGVQARLFGAELEHKMQLPLTLANGRWSVQYVFDFVRGQNLTSNQSLARMPPVRNTLGLEFSSSLFSADLQLQRSEKQNYVAAYESTTAAYHFVNTGIQVPFSTNFGIFSVLARMNNIFNAEGRNHVSTLKELAPLPGRNFILGLQANM